MATNQSSTRMSKMSDEAPSPNFGVVAAIDFGTSSSGFAFGFPENNSSDIRLADIQLNKWQLGDTSFSTDKAPTTLLLKPDKTFHSFGFEAETKFASLSDKTAEKGWWYFQRFKMALYETKLTREQVLHDAEGKALPAKEVFSIVIAHLKTCILQEVRRQNPDVTDDDVLYILTVPAIWSDAAKQFMREAATAPQVGIKDQQLKLVIEPEAASVFCRRRKSRVVRDTDGTTNMEALDVGHRYIIIDLGGGTADIATHTIIEHEQLHELDYARGDNLGGQLFDESFIIVLGDIFGSVFKRWASKKHGDYLRLLRTIEGVKWKVASTDDDIVFELPYSLVEAIKSEKVSSLPFARQNSVEMKVSKSNYSANVKVISVAMLQINNDFVKGFFKTILEGVIQHVNDIVTASDIETVFLVGGLAKSGYVRRAVQTAFPQYTFIVPEDPGVAVLKGAVLLGNKPQIIAGRVAKYSYGIGVCRDFVEGRHAERYKFTRDGKVLCSNIFKPLIKKGQVLKYGAVFTTTMHETINQPERKQRAFTTTLYQSTSQNPGYTTDPDCINLGCITETPPEGGWPDYWDSEVKVVVGEANFRFYITDQLGRKYETSVDFLSHRESR